VTLYSVPARTLVAPVTGKSLPLRLRTASGCAGSPMRPILAPTTGPRPPAPAGAAPGAPPRPPAPAGAAPRPPPRPPPPPAPATTTRGGGANIHPPDAALAHGSVPGGLDLAGVVDCDSAVDDDKGIRYTADRAILVVEHRGPIAPTAVIIVAPLILHRREIHRLGVDEFRALYSVVGAHSEAGKQQVRDRSRLAGGVVLVIHEGDIVQFMTVIVELVGADREIRGCGLRQAGAVGHFRRRPGVADVLGFTHEQRVHHP